MDIVAPMILAALAVIGMVQVRGWWLAGEVVPPPDGWILGPDDRHTLQRIGPLVTLGNWGLLLTAPLALTSLSVGTPEGVLAVVLFVLGVTLVLAAVVLTLCVMATHRPRRFVPPAYRRL